MIPNITNANSYQSSLASILNAQQAETTAGAQVSSGEVSQNLQGYGSQAETLVATQSVMANVNGLVSQLNSTSTMLTFQQQALTQVSSTASSLQQSLLNAVASGSGDGLMSQVQTAFSQASSALNTQYDGAYIFSGGQTSTQPFSPTSLTALAALPSAASAFQNGTLVPTSRVDDNTSVQTGFLASDVGSSLMGVFQSIQQFEQGASGSFGGTLTTAQQTFLNNAISQLGNVVTSTTQTTAQGGDVQNQVQTAITTQTDRQTTLQSAVGDMTDVNMAQAAASLSQSQTAYQASAQVFNTIKNMSLLNYLTTSTTIA